MVVNVAVPFGFFILADRRSIVGEEAGRDRPSLISQSVKIIGIEKEVDDEA
jgi:hypothetical protein